MQTIDELFRPHERSLPDDIVDRQVNALIHYWNRSHPDARNEFLAVAEEADGGLLEPL